MKRLVDRELQRISDLRAIAHIRRLRVVPECTMRDWGYGAPGEQFPCWSVLRDATLVGVDYCEYGFGPRQPWGLVWLKSPSPIGMDSGWFGTLAEAYFESMGSDLPIWRVFKTDASGVRVPVTGEQGWDATWAQVMALRARDTASRYDCDHGIAIAPDAV